MYLAGDNNLTEEMAWSLQELKITAEDMERRLSKVAHGAKHPINLVAHFDPRGARGRRYDFIPTSNKATPQPPAALDGNLDHYEASVYTPTVIEPFAKEIGIDPRGPSGRCRSLWRRAR